MNLREIIEAYSKLAHMPNVPEAAPYVRAMREQLEQLPQRLALPEKAYKQMKNNPDRAKELTDLIGSYTGVHPKEFSDDLLKDSISNYGDTGYRAINKIFRDPFGPAMSPDRNMQARIMMDAFMPTKNDMVLYRGLHEGKTADNISMMDRRNELRELGNKSFMSTSLDPYVAQQFSETSNPAYNFRIAVPAGTPVLPVHSYDNPGQISNELEYMLPPNSRFAHLPRTMDSNYTDLVLSRHGQMQEPDYVPDEPGVGWLAGLAPLGLLSKYYDGRDYQR